jgi:hypothetical protein
MEPGNRGHRTHRSLISPRDRRCSPNIVRPYSGLRPQVEGSGSWSLCRVRLRMIYLLVHNLIQQGMDCLRINCAHDDAAGCQWLETSLTNRCCDRSRMLTPVTRRNHRCRDGGACRVRPAPAVFSLLESLFLVSVRSHTSSQPQPVDKSMGDAEKLRRLS